MKYMEVSGSDRISVLCSDQNCACGWPGATIPRGKGYMYISKKVPDFRHNCLTKNETIHKTFLMSDTLGAFTSIGACVFSSMLICGQGARKRGINLGIAAADAAYWWKTGKVPLRVTPKARSKEMITSKKPVSLGKKWWYFWKGS